MNSKYDPVPDGIQKKQSSVLFQEQKPPEKFQDFVHSYWELKTVHDLEEDFKLHVIPDACVNALLNLRNPLICAFTYRQTTYVELNLGRSFHYAGIQFFPGVWQGEKNEIQFGFVNSEYKGKFPLIKTAKQMIGVDFLEFANPLNQLVTILIQDGILRQNVVTERILNDIEEIESVEEMAAAVNLSTRQLQRKLKESTGFSPHDFLKILRLQQAFRKDYLDFYVDQSHFINHFKKITGFTPKEYFKTFHV
ncbi:transcriptional regulator, AraC domain protein [Leptospira ryugenii]|uniref:Transcriptional regulator, AraC domain protein n=1 Tax=Leptospira ryugenii TaxID=1917863 RepID=A0A2P2DXF0_9LEPT|nr:AraC family transcriptional regulator [Leptospira ryugenii]GBF49315.1 transcriptional regulator, AraC domain protein [Leptospira ryugenii]